MSAEPLPRVVVDTNVLVGALLNRDSSAAEIARLWRERRIDLLYTNETLAEARSVVGQRWVERVAPDSGEPAALLAEIEVRGIHIGTPPRLGLSLRDAGDRRLVEAAVAGAAGYLVTSDRELLNMREYAGVRILTAREFLNAV
jgi:uncharacterized protein